MVVTLIGASETPASSGVFDGPYHGPHDADLFSFSFQKKKKKTGEGLCSLKGKQY